MDDDGRQSIMVVGDKQWLTIIVGNSSQRRWMMVDNNQQ